MSHDITASFPRKAKFSRADWNAALAQAGLPVSFDRDFDVVKQGGVLPFRYKGKAVGPEYAYHTEWIGRGRAAITFYCHGEEEAQAAFLALAGLAQLVGGRVRDPGDESTELNAADALREAYAMAGLKQPGEAYAPQPGEVALDPVDAFWVQYEPHVLLAWPKEERFDQGDAMEALVAAGWPGGGAWTLEAVESRPPLEGGRGISREACAFYVSALEIAASKRAVPLEEACATLAAADLDRDFKPADLKKLLIRRGAPGGRLAAYLCYRLLDWESFVRFAAQAERSEFIAPFRAKVLPHLSAKQRDDLTEHVRELWRSNVDGFRRGNHPALSLAPPLGLFEPVRAFVEGCHIQQMPSFHPIMADMVLSLESRDEVIYEVLHRKPYYMTLNQSHGWLAHTGVDYLDFLVECTLARKKAEEQQQFLPVIRRASGRAAELAFARLATEKASKVKTEAKEWLEAHSQAPLAELDAEIKATKEPRKKHLTPPKPAKPETKKKSHPLKEAVQLVLNDHLAAHGFEIGPSYEKYLSLARPCDGFTQYIEFQAGRSGQIRLFFYWTYHTYDIGDFMDKEALGGAPVRDARFLPQMMSPPMSPEFLADDDGLHALGETLVKRIVALYDIYRTLEAILDGVAAGKLAAEQVFAPDDTSKHFVMGRCCERVGRTADARRHYEAVAKLPSPRGAFASPAYQQNVKAAAARALAQIGG